MTARNLSQLDPHEFENLIFDLVIAKGLVNVSWRTPGADGGRDIEADSLIMDFAGVQDFSKWYIECKRYTKSVDWPTIYPKLAYADAAKADFLLLCSSAKYTPNATNMVADWNKSKRKPIIRLWPGHEIDNQLKLYPDIQLKYGLRSDKSLPGRSIVALSLALSKTIGSHYSAEIVRDVAPGRMLQAGYALAQLLQCRMEDMDRRGRILRRELTEVPEELSVEVIGKATGVDAPSFVAFASYLVALSRTRLRIDFGRSGGFDISGYDGFDDLLNRYRGTFEAIALWGDFEFTFTSACISATHREGAAK